MSLAKTGGEAALDAPFREQGRGADHGMKESLADAPDEALMCRIAEQRDASAFRILLQRHVSGVRAMAWRMLGDGEADDLVQDVFLRIWKEPERYRSADGRFSAWLHRVAMNAAIDRIRRNRTRQAEGLSELMPDENAPDPERHAMDSDRARKVRAAVARLPQRQRQALTLSHDLGYSNGEIAQMMDVSVEAVESLLARARRSLRKSLAAEIAELLDREDDAGAGK